MRTCIFKLSVHGELLRCNMRPGFLCSTMTVVFLTYFGECFRFVFIWNSPWRECILNEETVSAAKSADFDLHFKVSFRVLKTADARNMGIPPTAQRPDTRTRVLFVSQYIYIIHAYYLLLAALFVPQLFWFIHTLIYGSGALDFKKTDEIPLSGKTCSCNMHTREWM